MGQEKIKTNHFKIINVGFPKTASKSFSKALESLGYKVADLAQAIEYFEKDFCLDHFRVFQMEKSSITPFRDFTIWTGISGPNNRFVF